MDILQQLCFRSYLISVHGRKSFWTWWKQIKPLKEAQPSISNAFPSSSYKELVRMIERDSLIPLNSFQPQEQDKWLLNQTSEEPSLKLFTKVNIYVSKYRCFCYSPWNLEFRGSMTAQYTKIKIEVMINSTTRAGNVSALARDTQNAFPLINSAGVNTISKPYPKYPPNSCPIE